MSKGEIIVLFCLILGTLGFGLFFHYLNQILNPNGDDDLD